MGVIDLLCFSEKRYDNQVSIADPQYEPKTTKPATRAGFE